MAIQLPCPRCQRPLFIEGDSAGQIVKCPGCLVEFVVPGGGVAGAVAMVAPPVATEVTVADVTRAELAAQQAAAGHLAVHIELLRAVRRRQRLAASLKSVKFFLAGRHFLDHSVTRVGGFCIAVTVGGGLFFVASNLFSPSAVGYLLAALAGIVITAAAYLPFSFVPADEALAVAVGPLTTKLAAATTVFEQAQVLETKLQEEMALAQAEHARLLEILESRKQWLRTCQWPVMTGATFEKFLEEVFKELGYTVLPTGTTGDQGVDLIIAKDGLRTAVQAKGYVGQTVGNAAVQQAHAGKGFHSCQKALVVTNSTFTASAKELAGKIHCQLIDGSQMVELIDGRIVV